MKCDNKSFLDYMSGTKIFVIPVYQRNYDWKMNEQCKQLYHDIKEISQKNSKKHFFGCIVYMVQDPYENTPQYIIIDGQQRLTTVSLLLLAMYRLLKEKKLKSENSDLQNRIYEQYLVNKFEHGDAHIKLRHIKKDQSAFTLLLTSNDSSEYVPNSNLTLNYRYFYDRLLEEKLSLDELFKALLKLEIVAIGLKPGEDDPQLIFESLNSTGLNLNEGDKIRNYVLMNIDTSQQDYYYENYWQKIEKYTADNVGAFVRDYLSLKQGSIPSTGKVYLRFKVFVEETYRQATRDLFEDLLRYAKLYHILLQGDTGDAELSASISRLNRLETTVTRPFFLEILRLQNEGKLDVVELREIFLAVESFIFRRLICHYTTNSLNKIFLTLHRDVMKFDGTTDNYVEKFKFVMLSLQAGRGFPVDEEFIKDFRTRDIYNMRSKSKIYILERLENYGTKEDKDIYRHWDDHGYSIEHIMPRTLNSVWKRELGPDWEKIHEEWLNRLANLTLTAYNSKYSNNSFEKKKNGENGFASSGIRLNTWVARQEHWGLAELQARTEMLMQKALKIWPRPVTSYQGTGSNQDEELLLNADISFTNKKLRAFCYRDHEPVRVDKWSKMFVQVVKLLHEQDKSVLYGLVNADHPGALGSFFSKSKGDLRRGLLIDQGIYVEMNTDTGTKIKVLNWVFEEYKEDPEDLVLVCRSAASPGAATTAAGGAVNI